MSKYDAPEFSELKKIKNETGLYRLPVSWQVYSTIEVEADNLLDALKKAESRIDDIPLGDNDEVEYIDGSYQIDIDSSEDAINAQLYRKLSPITVHKDDTISHL